MKVLLVDNSPSMGGSVRNGAALARTLAKSGSEVALLASRPDLFSPLVGDRVVLAEVAWEGFRDVFAPELGLVGGGLPVIGTKIALRRFRRRLRPEIERVLDAVKPDLMHLNNLNLPQAPFVEAVVEAGLPLVMHCRMIRPFGSSEKRLAAQADRLICVSNAVRDSLLAQSDLDAGRVMAIGNGLSLERYAGGPDKSARERLGLPAEAFVACMLGRVVPWKGHHVAIAAWRSVVSEFPEAVLAIVGTGDADYHESCKALVGRLGLGEAVRFLGHHDNVIPVLRAGDLLLHASCYDDPAKGVVEAFGRVVIEAMAAGLPVVATAAGGVTEVVKDGVTGHLARTNDPDALADGVLDYLRHPERALEAGFAGRRRVREHFTIEKIVEQVSEIYRQALAEH